MRSENPASGVPLRASDIMVKTVVFLLRFSRLALPMTPMFTEYRPVLTMMPASRLSTPILVWRKAVTRPLSMPAHMAAGMLRSGWPASTKTAAVAAPRVKQPSVERSQTLSIE